LSQYCGYLQQNGLISSCGVPPVDPPPPAPLTTCNCQNVVVDILSSGEYPPWMGPNENGYDFFQLLCPPNTFATAVYSATDPVAYIYAWGKNKGYPSSGITCCELCPIEANAVVSEKGSEVIDKNEKNQVATPTRDEVPSSLSLFSCNCQYQMDSINSASSYPGFLQPNSENDKWTSLDCPANYFLVELDCSIDAEAHWLAWGKNTANPTCGIQCCQVCYVNDNQNTTLQTVGSNPMMVNDNSIWPSWMPPNSLGEAMISVLCQENTLATGLWSSIGVFGDMLGWGKSQKDNPAVALLCSSVSPVL